MTYTREIGQHTASRTTQSLAGRAAARRGAAAERPAPEKLSRVLLGLAAALVLLAAAPAAAFAAGGGEAEPEVAFSIAVFVPGVVEGSPTYEMLVAGVEAAADEREDVAVRVIEGGFNQAEWSDGLTSLSASGEYDLIVSSNPSLPEIAAEVAEGFPDQRFLILDGYGDNHPGMATVLFNQREQAFLNGYFAGLVTTHPELGHAREDRRVGLLAGQEYPIMNEVIRPGFALGAQTVDADIEVDFRVLGNWYDAGTANELAGSMIDRGADVILTIAGGGNQGVIAAAKERGGYVLWFDSSGYDQEPGVVLGSSIIRLDTIAYERTLQAIDGELSFGVSEVVGVREGYVDFDTEHSQYERHVPADIRAEIDDLLERMRTGELELEMPRL